MSGTPQKHDVFNVSVVDGKGEMPWYFIGVSDVVLVLGSILEMSKNPCLLIDSREVGFGQKR